MNDNSDFIFMEKQELLNLLYSERQRLSDRYTKPGWNNWVLLGAILYCILFSIDLFSKNLFIKSNVFELICFISFWIFTLLLFNKKIVRENRGFIEERFLLTSIKKTLKIVKWVLGFSIAIYWINLIINVITSHKKIPTIDFTSIMLMISWFLLVLIIIGISFTSMIDKTTARIFKFHALGNLLIFSSLMLINYGKDWTNVDLQFSIIIVVFVITIVLLWYTNIEKDISSIDDLIDDVIIFDIPDSNSVIDQLKIITINTSLDFLFTFKISRINNLKILIYRLLISLSKVVDQMNADYFLKTDAKQIRESFFNKSDEIFNLSKDFNDSLEQMLAELRGALKSIQSIRKKKRLENTMDIISEFIDESKAFSKMHHKLVDEAIKKLPQCLLCENCLINCENEIDKIVVDR